MRRILHVDHSPVLGGAERSVLELARAQVAAGEDARVAVGREGAFLDALVAAEVPATVVGWRRRYVETAHAASVTDLVARAPASLDAALKLRRAVAAVQPDIVQAHTRKAQLAASMGLVGRPVPLVWHLRDDVPARPALRRLLRPAIRRATHAVALSDWLADHYRAEGLLPRSGRIDIVPSGVDPGPLRDLPTPWLDGERPPVVGFVGHLAAWKAPHLIVDIAEQLGDLPDVRFAIIGDVWFRHSDGGYGAWLDGRIEGSPAADRIARLSTRSPAEAFAALDVLVHTSADPEPFGRVIVEAMMARRPVVAFRRGAPVELLDASTGALADGFDANAIATAVRSVIADTTAARAMADRAAASAERFTPARVADAMDKVYEALIP
jgi:glycosyltransferase involved in cell wall biosynthesis